MGYDVTCKFAITTAATRNSKAWVINSQINLYSSPMASSITTTTDSSDSTLSSWVQTQLTNIYTSTDPTSATLFQNGDTSPFADNVRITMNENQLSKEEFGEDVRKRKVAAAKVDVTYGDVTQQVSVGERFLNGLSFLCN